MECMLVGMKKSKLQKYIYYPNKTKTMKKLFVILICCCTALTIQAQKKAITENGEEVILYDDGTWKYVEVENEKKEIPTNPDEFKKSESSSFLLKSTNINIGVWLNPKKWSFKKATDNLDAEYEISKKDGDLYGMLITEKIEIPLSTLKDIALENGKSVSPDLRVVKEEYRNVNGLKVLLLKMNGTMQGIKFTYYGYYFSNQNGTVQFITYTSQNLMNDYLKDCDELLNGLVETK